MEKDIGEKLFELVRVLNDYGYKIKTPILVTKRVSKKHEELVSVFGYDQMVSIEVDNGPPARKTAETQPRHGLTDL